MTVLQKRLIGDGYATVTGAGTTTNIVTFALPSDSSATINAYIVARQTNGVGTGDSFTQIFGAGVRNVSGTATVIGSSSLGLWTDTGLSTCSSAVSASSGNIILSFTIGVGLETGIYDVFGWIDFYLS